MRHAYSECTSQNGTPIDVHILWAFTSRFLCWFGGGVYHPSGPSFASSAQDSFSPRASTWIVPRPFSSSPKSSSALEAFFEDLVVRLV